MGSVGDGLQYFLQTLPWQTQFCRCVPPMAVTAGMVADFQQKLEKFTKLLLVLEADAQPLTLVNDTLEGGIHPQIHLNFFGYLHGRAVKLPLGSLQGVCQFQKLGRLLRIG